MRLAVEGKMKSIKRILHENGLSIAMFGLFFIFFLGQIVTGLYHYNDNQREHGQAIVNYWQYLHTGDFLESVFENWESEFLQMCIYVVLTGFLYQRGSAGSKNLTEPQDVDADPEESRNKKGVPYPVRRGGLLLALYKYSLSIALFLLFLISFILHAIYGAEAYTEDHAQHGMKLVVNALQYMGTSRFWFESFQNWQSEFLSVGAIVVLSIFLRHKGSPESKPVAAPHDEEPT